jgi:membrane protein DedA with SNARE-associated domain
MIPTTGIAIIDWFLAAMQSYGYLIVFGITIFENLFVVGSFTPGETFVIAGGFTAAQGGLSLSGVWLASVFGTILGSNISFWFGHRQGRSSLEALSNRLEGTRLGRLVGIHRGSLQEAESYFERWGSKTIFVSRFAVGMKNFMPVIAGASKMPVWAFELWTLAGAITYTSAMCAIGWFLGQNFDKALRLAGTISWAGCLVMLTALVAIIVLRRRSQAREAAEAAAAAAADEAVEEEFE